MTTPRITLEPPERTEPIRSWRGVRRAGEPSAGAAASGAAATESDGAEGDDSWSEVVTRGVQLGYEVVEEHIRQGERVARQINNRNYTPRAAGNDIWEFAERSARFSMDLLGVWWSLLGAMPGAASLGDNPFVPPAPGARRADGGREPADDAANGAAVAVAVRSAQPVEVTLDLRPGAARHRLASSSLRALGGEFPDITDVTFVRGTGSGRGSVQIAVPESQPAGSYAGVVFERDTRRALGTLTVRVGD